LVVCVADDQRRRAPDADDQRRRARDGDDQVIPDAVFAQTLLGFLAPVAPFLHDDGVSEIMINGPDEVYVERGGRIERTDVRFASPHALESAVRNIAQYVGKSVSADQPLLDARLPDGSRVSAVLPPASRRGILVSIRRFPKQRLTVDELVRHGALGEGARRFLELSVLCKRNIIVGGGTGSGKTSLLNALSSFVPDGERIVVIEDSSELQLQQPHALYLEARPPDAKGRGAVTIRDLLRQTLRLRPDRIVVGECRGGEAIDLVQAMTSGHGGSLSTVHATWPHDTLHRLETLCLMSDVELPLSALRAQLASAVNIIVQTARMNDGSRKLTHIAECVGLDAEGHYQLHMLYEFAHAGVEAGSGRVLGQLRATGQKPTFAGEIVGRGLALPTELSG
jgi:pilus assembly protein CpaF